MVSLLIGGTIGLVMGLTGAGGALVAIPLFMQLEGMSLKAASVYSLMAVIIASLLAFISQKTKADNKVAIILVLASIAGSALTAPLKPFLADTVIVLLLALISIFALYRVWRPGSANQKHGAATSWWMDIGIGLILGALTTFTGLGGGVLLMPVFLSIYHFSQAKAVVTSVLVIGLSSLFSLILQVSRNATIAFDMKLAWLICGMLVASLMITLGLKHLPQGTIHRTRQVVFTMVVVFALAKLLTSLS